MNRRRQWISGLRAAAVAALLVFSGTARTTGPNASAQGGGCLSNAIVCENQNTGSPSTEWDVVGSGDATIQGFATEMSVNRGATVRFKIKTDATAYQIAIYRMGYYGGLGARRIATIAPTAALPQTQPPCLTETATGLVDCGNWAESASWTVPATAASGVYFAKLTRTSNGGASHIVFVVRDDAGTADLVFQTSDSTWQAYNRYGGNSLYTGGPGTNPNRAYKVSYNRPLDDARHDAGQLGVQRRVPDGPVARVERLQRQLHQRHRHGPQRRDDSERDANTRRSCRSATTSTGRRRSAPTSRRRAPPG